MNKNTVSKLLAACLLFVGTTGCSVTTEGKGEWEVYAGVRTRQIGDKPASVSIKSSVVDKIVNSILDDEVTEE